MKFQTKNQAVAWQPSWRMLVLRVALLFFAGLVLPQFGPFPLLGPMPVRASSPLTSGFNGFGETGILHDVPGQASLLQSDNKVVTAEKAGNAILFTRYLTNGTLDPSFGTAGQSTVTFPIAFEPVALVQQRSGAIVVGGTKDDEHVYAVGRILPDGTLDPNFDFVTGELLIIAAHHGLFDLTLQTDDKIVAAGSSVACSDDICAPDFDMIFVVRIGKDGGMDGTFHNLGGNFLSFGSDRVMGQRVLSAFNYTYVVGTHRDSASVANSVVVVRFRGNGELDATFGDGGKVIHPGISDDLLSPIGVLSLPDGRLLIGGHADRILALLPDGSKDLSFGEEGVLVLDGPFGPIEHIKLASHALDGFLAVGQHTARTGEPAIVATVIKPDGTLDTSFGDGVGAVEIIGAEGVVSDLHTAIDGRVVVELQAPDGEMKLLRLHVNGSLDHGGWVTSDWTPRHDELKDLVIQPDGKISAVGSADALGQMIARYQADGVLDTSLGGKGYLGNFSFPVRSYAQGITLDHDANMLVVSAHEQEGAILDFAVHRYAQSGAPVQFPQTPNLFPITDWGSFVDEPVGIEMLADGEFIVAGTADDKIAATSYRANGLLAKRYTPIDFAGAPDIATDMALQADGKLIVVGAHGENLLLFRYGTDGNIDPLFRTQIKDLPGLDQERLEAVAVQPDGKIVVVGTANSSNGVSDMIALRFHANGMLDESFGDGGLNKSIFPSSAQGMALAFDREGNIILAGCSGDKFAIARLLPNGSPDLTFASTGKWVMQDTPTAGPACATVIAYDATSDSFVLGGSVTIIPGVHVAQDKQWALARINFPKDPNSVPMAQSDAYVMEQGTVLHVDAPGLLANDSDLDNDKLFVHIAQEPLHGMVVGKPDGAFVYTPTADFIGEDHFTYYALDSVAASELVTVTITVEAAPATNLRPVAQSNAYATLQEEPLTIAAPGVLDNDTDADGDSLTAVLDTPTSQGTLVLNVDGSFTYTPSAGFVGEDHFTYHASDGTHASDTVTVTLAVALVTTNVPPAAVGNAYSVRQDSLLVQDAPGVLDNDSDADGDALTAELADAPTNGTLSLQADGSFTYQPEIGFVGLDSFTYRLSDGMHLSETAKVMIEVMEETVTAQQVYLPMIVDQ